MVCWVLTVSEPHNTHSHGDLQILHSCSLCYNAANFFSLEKPVSSCQTNYTCGWFKTRPDVLRFHQHCVFFRRSTVTVMLRKWNQWWPVWGVGGGGKATLQSTIFLVQQSPNFNILRILFLRKIRKWKLPNAVSHIYVFSLIFFFLTLITCCCTPQKYTFTDDSLKKKKKNQFPSERKTR